MQIIGVIFIVAGFLAISLASRWWGRHYSQVATYGGALSIALGLILIVLGAAS